MSDFVLYFGPLEFIATLLLVAGLTGLIAYGLHRRQLQQRRARLLNGFPFPALLFERQKLALANPAASETWGNNLDIQTIVADSLRTQQNTVRTIPAVEGQSYQVRALRLSSSETLILLEDLADTQRQQTFYRNFIQNVSHELKTPLTVIQGHAAKMGDAPDDREGWQASRRIITDEAKRLTQLVDNLLTLSRLESPAFTLDRAPLNFAALLEESILQVSDLAEERKLILTLNSASGLPRLNGDRARLKQVVLNLLDNAIKYTPSGGTITVTTTLVKTDSSDLAQVLCSVQDSGEGIPADDLAHVFDKLYRARRLKGRPVEGSGLGLSIAQQIIQAHGGTITAKSELGKGSVFTLGLPL